LLLLLLPSALLDRLRVADTADGDCSIGRGGVGDIDLGFIAAMTECGGGGDLGRIGGRSVLLLLLPADTPDDVDVFRPLVPPEGWEGNIDDGVFSSLS
jgi:hypothetical protein